MTVLLEESVTASNKSKHGCTTVNPTVGAKIRLILVDDDGDYREAATMELETLGFQIDSFPEAEPMFEHLMKGEKADAIVLDWVLSSGPGIELLPRLRGKGIQTPVIFLTGMPTTTYESTALDRGAIDFVDKARGIPILARRVRRAVHIAGQAAESPEGDLRCGKLLLRPGVCRAYWKGQDVELTFTEFNIVYLMVTHGGEYVTYRSIYDRVRHAGFIAGNGDQGYRTNVRSSIKRIRNKFRAIDVQFSEIKNFAAFGYSWQTMPSNPD
jgi:two-component system, OmpR family, response regulator ChvI